MGEKARAYYIVVLKTKRIYEPPERGDGTRILVMRFWPRGIRRALVDEWNRDLAPSRELVLEFKRGGLPWKEYARRYWQEISAESVDLLRRRALRETLTLLCSCEDESKCHRGLLKSALKNRGRSRPNSRRAGSGGRA